MKVKLGHLNTEDILALEKQNRTTLINSLSGFKTAGLIGTKNLAGQTNLAIFNSFIHIGAHPPLIGFISRPGSVERHTLENILETGYYTINYVTENIVKQAHQTSARYAQIQSEFKETGLTEEYRNSFIAPFVKECQIKIGVEFKEKIEISINNTILLIGKITDIYFPENILQQDGFLDLELTKTVVSCGLDSYHITQKMGRFSYAKPESKLKEIN